MWICIASCREHTSKALRYGMHSQGISQCYLHTPHSSTNGMNHTCLNLPSRSWSWFTDPRGMEGWVGRNVKVVLTLKKHQDIDVQQSLAVQMHKMSEARSKHTEKRRSLFTFRLRYISPTSSANWSGDKTLAFLFLI